ncbi:hypothetical protein L1987_50286 [Smallanthus sonchifolius]|uniref:Uncharacterized protein n=1 Tax=Smallanthus sonchifolius TaxID=185202 RepID=A0ACB9EMF7_9ASTR|nr:hypothetical protein L1987_50286 [Smallanthus sonchifolius]
MIQEPPSMADDLTKLNLDAPFLSTRRPNASTTHPNSRPPSNRVPFSWELSAGKPKHTGTQSSHDHVQVPPPPGRKLVEKENEYDGDDDFSDAMDTFSLSAAIDMVESAEMAKRNGNMLDGMELDSGGNQSPTFIIQRFLWDAKALAVSSGLPIPNNISNQRSQMINSSPKGCGLGLDGLFAWRTKHKRKPPCGVKSPVRVTSASVKSQWGWKPKPG